MSEALPSHGAVMRVLYLHPFGAYGGATKSLSEMVKALPRGRVLGTAITPSGVAQRALSAAGLKTIAVRGLAQWDDTRYGHYRGLRWLILLRELAYVPSTILALWTARRMSFDLIHCNEVTALLPGLLAKRILRTPLVVHVRSLQRTSGGGRISACLRRRLREGVDAVVAIDEAVRRSLPDDLPVTVIHNGMRDPGPPTPEAREDGPLRVAIVGVLHKAKGVHEFVAAARLLRDRGVSARLIVVGENIRSVSGIRGRLLRAFDFAHDVRGQLEAYVAQHRLQDIVEFTGFLSDVGTVYRGIDVLCFPSHLDAPGRPVFEAALFALPSIVAMRNPTSDVVVPGRTGICIDEPTPEAIADAIETLAGDRSRVRRMGAEARRLALGRFESSRTAAAMLALYRRVHATSQPYAERP